MKVAIIGAGWYGCHMAYVLLNMGIEVEIYERNETLFLGSSGNNQFRLHEGLHYPRSYKTRVQIVEGFQKFLEIYPFLTIPIENNMYAIAEKESLLDFGTFRQVMEGSKIHHKEVPLTHMKDTKLRRVEGILLARERALLVNTPAVFFEQKLRSSFRFKSKITSVTQISTKDPGSRKTLTQFCHTSNNYYKTANIEEDDEGLLEAVDEEAETETDFEDSTYDRIIVNNKEYDWCINCTYQQLFPLPHIRTFFEPCLAFIYKDIRSEEDMPDTMAFTVMDGEFCSLYPYITDEETFKNKPHDRFYTLTHVSHTPLGNFSDFEEAEKCRLSLHQNKNLLEKKRKLFEAGIIKFYRNFLEHFQYFSFFTGMKTKFSGASAASRECIVARDDRLIHVISGKVNTLFNAEERILKLMGLRSTPRITPRVQ